MSTPIRIKPHHFIDIIGDLGRGATAFEPHPYGHAVHVVAAKVLRERDAMLEMELGADDVCAPCVHNVGGLCDDAIDTSFRPAAPASKRAYNLLIDGRWCARLSLAQGDELTARRFCQRLRDGMGDLTGIYCENPPDRVAARDRALRLGVALFLGEQAESG